MSTPGTGIADDTELAQAWDDFCETLKSAKSTLFLDNAPKAAHDRAAGLRMLARNIALALDMRLENADPLRPQLTHYFDWRRKQGGDNADALYLGAAIDGSQTYRLSGRLGSAAFAAFTVIDDGATPWGGAAAGTLLAKDLQTDAQGRFELLLSPEPQPGNWLKTGARTIRLTIRQFFGDWDNETPMAVEIERAGEALPPPEFSVDGVMRGLRDAAAWLADVTGFWHNTLGLWQKRPLEFLSLRQVMGKGIDATPGGEPYLAYWDLQSDEALIIRVRPPGQSSFWNFEFGNWWMETMDYRHRLSGTNHHHAVVEDDGEVVLVVSQDDPGLPNWLDASGYSCGYLVCRWMGADSAPQPVMRRVKRSQLMAELPAGVRRIDAAGRSAQLTARNRGIRRRFAGY
ncbi:MAG: hypothetical protein JWQ90_3824 [Hydrocarboniphaga sp.]|uniref:DUF1214 domain-containing protein n=1 Tax=Hydrocarboniphaga sp. TaxID=2033016 RepID=UPI002606F415|nr:DUF1214 domain-containing protein [Hydrocarboniphaga sp.]MDB5971374.1 hypothetical protein [Hydrocarboniphaga sp.]